MKDRLPITIMVAHEARTIAERGSKPPMAVIAGRNVELFDHFGNPLDPTKVVAGQALTGWYSDDASKFYVIIGNRRERLKFIRERSKKP